MNDLHRAGLSLTIGAMCDEQDHLAREVNAISADHLQNASDVMLKSDLEQVKKHAERIAALAGIEIDRLISRLKRRPEIQAAE